MLIVFLYGLALVIVIIGGALVLDHLINKVG